MKDPVFVFGSNLAGRHGAGAAKTALLQHGAVYGQGYGFQGNSYAIPTKDEEMNVIPVDRIAKYVDTFLRFAELNPSMTFNVTRIGCGLAGYEDADIAPLFKGASANCILPAGWRNM
jgi:hypothetical protein